MGSSTDGAANSIWGGPRAKADMGGSGASEIRRFSFDSAVRDDDEEEGGGGEPNNLGTCIVLSSNSVP